MSLWAGVCVSSRLAPAPMLLSPVSLPDSSTQPANCICAIWPASLPPGTPFQPTATVTGQPHLTLGSGGVLLPLHCAAVYRLVPSSILRARTALQASPRRRWTGCLATPGALARAVETSSDLDDGPGVTAKTLRFGPSLTPLALVTATATDASYNNRHWVHVERTRSSEIPQDRYVSIWAQFKKIPGTMKVDCMYFVKTMPCHTC